MGTLVSMTNGQPQQNSPRQNAPQGTPQHDAAQQNAAQQDAGFSDFYREVGEETFAKMVAGFYRRVPEDDILGPMYPDDDWEGAEARLRMFLEQYWGGPQDYSIQRGHPRLRMRHNPFTIDVAARDRWLELMISSLDEIPAEELSDAHRAAIWEHMVRVADMLINEHP